MDPEPAPSEPSTPRRGARTGTSTAALVLLLACALCCIAPAAALDPPPGEQYACVDQWGVTLSWPRGVAVDAAGAVYVADSGTNRICRNMSGGLRWFGNSLNLQFNQPSGVAVDADGNVYVADYGNRRVQKFTPAGSLDRQFGVEAGPGRLAGPRGVDLDSAGNVYVSDLLLHRVVEYDPCGAFLRMWGRDDGAYGDGPGEFRTPYGLALDWDGTLYVADTGNNRVQEFGPNGDFVGTCTNPSGAADGGFSSPVDVALDRDGNVYVVESVGNRIQKLSGSGAFLTAWGTAGTGYGQFRSPQGATVDAAGRVYVTQGGSNRVQVFAARLAAGLAPDPRSGPAPLEVRFADASGGSPTGWAWDFGDGGTSTDRNPVHTFARPGAYAVSLTVTRAGAAPSTASATVEVTDPSPVAAPDTYGLDEDGVLAVPTPGVLANDGDPGGDPVTALYGDDPLHGTVALAPDGSFTYTPSPDFSGTDSFTYTASDGTHASGPATVTLHVSPVNDPPVAAGDTYTVAEDTPLSVPAPGVLANDHDVDGPALSAIPGGGPGHGTLTLAPDGAFAYTPDADFHGEDSFAYTVSDGDAQSGTARVAITVDPVNDPPVADPVSVATDEDAAVAVTLAGADADGDALVCAVTAGPAHGTLSGTVPRLSYLPDPDYAGPDGFSFTVSDGQATSRPATVTIAVTAVNDPPAISPALSVPVDPGPVNAVVTAGASFTDPDPGDAHAAAWDWGDGATSAGTVAGGTVSGSHAYTAAGVYTIGLALTDGTARATATAAQYTVVYDPDGGFVTGGGWIASPPGAFAADPALSGKATFGFVSKYRKGQTVPTGETEFQFRAAGMDFRSSSYDWLVVAGARAQYRGTGTVNGAGPYGFMLTAIDGAQTRAGPDTFRIRIWDRAAETAVYDNQVGAPDTADPATALGGGSVVVHRG